MLNISLLGGFQCLYGDENVTERLGGRAQSLLAFLLLHRATPQPRQFIAFTLWPDSVEAQARTNLRYVLHALRHTFPEIEAYLALDSSTIQWRPGPPAAPAVLDVEQFEQALVQARQATQLDGVGRAIDAALAAYKGDLLPGYYEDWVTIHRDTLRGALLSGLDDAAQRLEQGGELRKALELLRRRRGLEPLEEAVYQDLMRLHWRLGDRNAVKRTYEACAAMLREELDVEPGTATETALHHYLTHEPELAGMERREISVAVTGASAAQSVPATVAEATQQPALLETVNPLAWVPQTKVMPPELRPDLTRRPRLEDALAAAFRTRSLAALSAPAGYGKTTLLASAVQAAGLPCAWLSVDEEDNDLSFFVYGLVAALRQLCPAFGTDTLAVLDAPDTSNTGTSNPDRDASERNNTERNNTERNNTVRRLAGVFINELLAAFPAPIVLVLDDIHAVTDERVIQFLAAFLDRLPPGLHVALGTRHEPALPLARWRSRQLLAEFGSGELAFRLEETAALLNENLRLGLSAQDLTTLHTQTEGWAAGLRLLAGSLVTVPAYAERSAWIDQLVDGGRHVFELLAQEVLRRQEPEVQEFLVKTSILPVLTPGLCRAVTGRADAGQILANLYRRNLFLVQLSHLAGGATPGGGDAAPALGMGPAYRYHALFVEFLRGQLHQQPEADVADLYRRAALAAPDRAISLYMQAGLWDDAADALENQGDALIRQGLGSVLARWLHTLPPELLAARPRLLYMAGVCAWLTRNLAQTEHYLRQALAGFEAVDERAGQGAALAYLAQLAFFRADFPLGLALVGRALEYPIEPPIRIQLLLERARIAQFQSQFEAGAGDVRAAYGLVQGTRTPAAIQAMLDGYVPGFAGMPGGLAELDSLIQLGELLLTPSNRVLEGLLHEQRLVLYLTRGELLPAIEAGRQALELGERLSGRPVWQHRVTKMLTLVAVAMAGFEEEAHQLIEELIHADQMLTPAPGVNLHPVSGILYLFAHSAWRMGRADVLEQTGVLLAPLWQGPIGQMTELALGMLDAARAIERGDHEQALTVLARVAAVEDAMPMHNLFGSAHALAACVYQRLGNGDAALAALERAFADCDRQASYGRILLERPEVDTLLQVGIQQDRPYAAVARRLLDQISRSGCETARGTGARNHLLSPREQEVLALVATGASNQAIADALIISVHTVKRHVAHILEKLNLASRVEAVAYYHTLTAQESAPAAPPASSSSSPASFSAEPPSNARTR